MFVFDHTAAILTFPSSFLLVSSKDDEDDDPELKKLRAGLSGICLAYSI